ncbi:AP-2 complex subunit sigma [Mucor velutinosus]|uniref:AP-2 complex subunit sigma n=1 Tax=Mucor velutinosus TaxID=708070 RepID=A0AAN7DRG1_9FUNG|nr:AP-2 complex subunit sigma [Mucor velutinosus]
MLVTAAAKKTVRLNNLMRKVCQPRLNHTIASDDLIHRVDFRVGKIVQIEQHPDAAHLFIEQVDLNAETTEAMPNPRTIVSGLAPFMPIESLLNRNVIVVSNLKPSKFRGVLSQGMLLAAATADSKTVRLLSPPTDSIIGERVALEGVDWQGQTDAVLKPKQKVFEQVASFLKTDASGIATYKGIALNTSAGPVICELSDAQIS